MGEEEAQKSIWNFDGAELYLIFQIKSAIVYALDIWDITTAYKKVRLLRMELDSKLQREKKKILEDFDVELEESKVKVKGKPRERKLNEKQEVDSMMRDLDDNYTNYTKDNNFTDEEKSLMFQKVEKFYMHLCYLMKKHGLYFREGDDMRLAVLRR